MEESTIIQSMLNILNSKHSSKKAILEALPILLDAYDVHGDLKVYNLIIVSAQNVCFQICDSNLENSLWRDSDISLDNLKSLLVYFIDILNNHSIIDVIQLFQHCVELSYKVDFNNCSIVKIRNIGFCLQKLYILCRNEVEDCSNLNHLRNALINILNESNLNKEKLDAILTFLNGIVSIYYIPNLWQYIKPTIKTHPDRTIHLLFKMQGLFFDSFCVSVILNDDDFWNLLCNFLTCENNVIRTYNNVILKLSCSQLSNMNINNYFSKERKEQNMKVWNDYVVVMETLENTQQHLILPIINTAKNIVSTNTDDYYNDYKLPFKWITAMYCKMAQHSSKYIVMASVDIITNMPITSLKKDERLLQSFLNSLNNVFLYKMSSEFCIDQPQLENILSKWFNKLIMSNDGYDIFGTFLSYIPNIKWSIVPLIFLTKSLANISLSSPSEFNTLNHVLKIKYTVEKMPNSYLKTIALSFLFTFTSTFFEGVNNIFCCDLFDCIMVNSKNTKTWDYLIDSIHKINNLNNLDKQLSQRINEKHKAYSTSIGLFILTKISINNQLSCINKLNEMCSNTLDDLNLDLLECLLNVESHYGKYDNCVSQILDKYIWPLTITLIEKCLEIKNDDLIICSFLDKVSSSNRIVNTTNIMNNWLIRCEHNMKHFRNYSVLAIYSWIGKYSTAHATEYKLKNDWLFFTKHFIDFGYFSLSNQDSIHLKETGIHTIPQLDIIKTFFQYSTVSEEQMLNIFDWLSEKTVECHDNYWSIYFSTVKTFLYKFPIKVMSKKIIQFIENCWEFLVSCRVSCYPNTIKNFIEMAFHYNLLMEEKYMKFVKKQIFQNLLTEKYSNKFNVCFSLILLKFLEGNESNIIDILESHQIISELFGKCLLYSIDRYGAIKIEWDTLEYIRTLNNFPLINDISIECLPDDKYLRFNTIKCLNALNSNILWKNVIQIIIKTETSLRDRKFFHNSKAYRIKQRIVQVLLIIACVKHHESLLFEENVYKWLLSSLKEVSHIHSVAYQLIWLLVLVYNRCYSSSEFWNDFKNIQENHNYVCSFISIIYHLYGIKKNIQFKNEAKEYLLPLCFSNGYKIRLYAQATICRLFSSDHEDFEWFILSKTIENIIAMNEQTNKYENPFNDFFYQELDLINSLSLKNVCIEVPRLLNIIYEERFLIKWFNDFSVTMNNDDDKYSLSHCSVSSFIKKNTTSVPSNEITVYDNAQNAQRKYIPSKPLNEDKPYSMLIVIASLIDKVTNLGGLARTCQVLGASTLVVDNLSCVQKREFTALSMTAEKHQYIIEVRVKNLKSYIQKKKTEGYQIIAAEQTVDSVKLHDIKLPFKCVLLLGNETSGIPHELLSIMNYCVEIEQLGIVRSLNVHVAGSLFIWEYTKQHCIKVCN